MLEHGVMAPGLPFVCIIWLWQLEVLKTHVSLMMVAAAQVLLLEALLLPDMPAG